MKIKLLFLILLFSFNTVFSQEDAWVYFKDKPNESIYLSNPLSILTQRALDRRARYNIPLDSKDAPIETTYISKVEEATGIIVLAKSKWLNAAHVQGSVSGISDLKTLDFVESIEFANKSLNTGSKLSKTQQVKSTKKLFNSLSDYDYGKAENQVDMLNVNELHLLDFTGEGMYIAVLDGGFPEVDNLIAFQNTKILGGYNLIDRTSDFYTRNDHGTLVLSTMAGVLENGINGATTNFVGTAPDASFYLFITEDTTKEVPLEESLWVEAAEEADRLGVDVINSSLGYSIFFDNPAYNYSYSDMDGNTAFVSRGAAIAFSKGMLIVNSVGNEGNSTSWPYMNAPADVASVLSIGAVDGNEVIADFSSYGPTSDNRLKPDVSAQGKQSYLINTSGNVITGNGTSFSSPIMAGAVACLWQAFPNKTNAEITQLIKESAHLYSTPNNHEGYGIPNFGSIYELLSGEEIENQIEEVVMYPNPVASTMFFKFPLEVDEINVQVYNMLGQAILTQNISKENQFLDISFLENNLYVFQISYNNKIQHFKILKN